MLIREIRVKNGFENLLNPRNLRAQFMSNIPSDLKYAKSHEWLRVSGDTATVGITDHASRTDRHRVRGTARRRPHGQGRRSLRRGGIRQDRERHLFARQRRDHRRQYRRGGQSRAREHRARQRRLVLQNQIEQRRRNERAALAGRLQKADWGMKFLHALTAG